jgi:hypothetical protein
MDRVASRQDYIRLRLQQHNASDVNLVPRSRPPYPLLMTIYNSIEVRYSISSSLLAYSQR